MMKTNRREPGGNMAPSMHYSMTETAFATAQPPAAAKEARAYIQDYKNGDILGQRARPGWNQSYVVPAWSAIQTKNPREVAKFDGLRTYEYNYRAEVLPKRPEEFHAKQSKLAFNESTLALRKGDAPVYNAANTAPVQTELPNHPDLVQKQQWNFSVAASTISERQSQLDAATMSAARQGTLRKPQIRMSIKDRHRHSTSAIRGQKQYERDEDARWNSVGLERTKDYRTQGDRELDESMSTLRAETKSMRDSTSRPNRFAAAQGHWNLDSIQ
jgi:hypothetical protein